MEHVKALRCEAIDTIRIGFVGLGRRGMATLARYLHMPHVVIAALCDIDTSNIDKAKSLLGSSGHDAASVFSSDDWTELCSPTLVDLLFVCTDWTSHATIACRAMESGVHVAVEVPAATTVEQCWRLVDTAEATRRHCFMLENCCYDPFTLRTSRLVKAGTLGEVVHYEGGYIHNLTGLLASRQWYREQYAAHTGNPYPTHGLGPAAMLMDINRSDRLVSLVSMSSGHDATSINNTLIRTEKGHTILLQHDISTPRPYSRLQNVCGTRGYVSKYPVEMYMGEGMDSPLTGKELDDFMEGYTHPFEDAYKADALAAGVDNLMNYYMDRRLIDCLRAGLSPDISVYDSALWSSVAELTALSVSRGGSPVEIPDFTRGR